VVTKIFPFYTLTAKLNGIVHEYAWLDNDPDVYPVVADIQFIIERGAEMLPFGIYKNIGI